MAELEQQEDMFNLQGSYSFGPLYMVMYRCDRLKYSHITNLMVLDMYMCTCSISNMDDALS